MSTEGIYVILVLVLAGVFSLGLSVMTLRGRFKGFYLFKGLPLVVPGGIVYTGFPAGVGALMLAVVLVVSSRQIGRTVVYIGSCLVMLSALVLMIWRPRWLKPKWLRWLEDNYPDYLLHNLLEEARRGGRAWEAQVRTQEDLEKWARQAVAKYRSRAAQNRARGAQ
jgi:hypothetical protein